jgi:hypothetical protein
VGTFRECDKGKPTLNHADRNPSLLTVVLTRVGANKKRAAEHFFRFGEVKPMFADVGQSLVLVPLNYQCNSKCSYISGIPGFIPNS